MSPPSPLRLAAPDAGGRTRRSIPCWLQCLVTVLLLQAGAGRTAPAPSPAANTPTGNDPSEGVLIQSVVAAEETLLRLRPRLEVLAQALLDLRLPGAGTDAITVFAPAVSHVDLAPRGPEPPREGTLRSDVWPLSEPAGPVGMVDLWRPLLDAVSYLDHASFQVLDGEHPGGDMRRFDARVGFEAVARMRTGEWRDLRGIIRTHWIRGEAPGGGTGEWQIGEWLTSEFQQTTSPQRFFAEVLDRAVKPPLETSSLRRSGHFEATVRYYQEGAKKAPHPYYAPISVNHKEGLAVADVNGDGLDDIYITVRIGRNMLLINQGDGTFSEEAARYHLDLPGHTTCALFADFDNDGDLDVILGRSLLRTSYLENRDGVYVQHPIPKFMPMAVISMAAADYNGDGLLDVYLCTYRPAAPAGSGTGGGYGQLARDGDFDWPDEFFTPDQAREFRRRLAEHRQRVGPSALDQLGPPNMLLVNRGGGRFEPAPENGTVGLWRNSLQATWSDINGDGRPDLYIPNDWGMNVLFQNDGPEGFRDVTTEAGLTYYGFSMGATFGDYDNDGRDDLYVSNMHSEAGRRLITRLGGMEKMFVESAMGNWLYHQQPDGRFRMVAGGRPPSMDVMRAGWSWGGCFADFDNDSFLDLYVLSGYFTAPQEVASGLDLESNLWRTMVRADANHARPSFRHAPEWKRTPPPDRSGPEIDARLAGVERAGERLLVHSLHGGERNRYFANVRGGSFLDVSGLSGLDNPADSRGFALLDFDRDGGQDLALVNANQPLFNLYHNQLPAAGRAGGVVALRFRGANRTPAAAPGKACRDGYGARVTLDLGDQTVVREHRCGEGWSTQHSARMLVGIGTHTNVVSVSVRWPSGRTTTTRSVPEGTLLTVFEEPGEASTPDGCHREIYRLTSPARAPQPPSSAVFPVRTWDTAARPARLRVYTSFATASPGVLAALPRMRQRQEALRSEGIDFVVVPVDPADDNARLAAFNRQWKPLARLVNLPGARRPEAIAAFAAALGVVDQLQLPSSVVTDEAGHILGAQTGVPTVSQLRQLMPSTPP